MSGEWQRDEPDSPCVKVCLLHPEAGLCIGCLRSGEEIARWPEMTPEERRALLAELPNRKAEIAPRRRGGRARTRAKRTPKRG